MSTTITPSHTLTKIAIHWQGRGRASGMSIDVRQFDVYEFRGGLIVRATLGLKSKADALGAAGLSE